MVRAFCKNSKFGVQSILFWTKPRSLTLFGDFLHIIIIRTSWDEMFLRLLFTIKWDDKEGENSVIQIPTSRPIAGNSFLGEAIILDAVFLVGRAPRTCPICGWRSLACSIRFTSFTSCFKSPPLKLRHGCSISLRRPWPRFFVGAPSGLCNYSRWMRGKNLTVLHRING